MTKPREDLGGNNNVAGRCVRATTRVEPLPLMQVEMDGRPDQYPSP